tara:strand:- start:179 stop:439 length:261 start_codon:yes stop_codon:yes gene_type:complete
MSSEVINKQVSARICKHMNSEHINAIRKYAIHYGGIKEFNEVTMTNLTNQFIELKVDNQIIQINFDHTLKDSEDAHNTLVKMLKSI